MSVICWRYYFENSFSLTSCDIHWLLCVVWNSEKHFYDHIFIHSSWSLQIFTLISLFFLPLWLINMGIWYDFYLLFWWLKVISKKKSWRWSALPACLLTRNCQSTVLCRKPSVWASANQVVTLIFMIQMMYLRQSSGFVHFEFQLSHENTAFWLNWFKRFDILSLFCKLLQFFMLASQMNNFQLISLAFFCLTVPSFLQMVDFVYLLVAPHDVCIACSFMTCSNVGSRAWTSHLTSCGTLLLETPKQLASSFEPERSSFDDYILMSLKSYEILGISKGSKLQKWNKESSLRI